MKTFKQLLSEMTIPPVGPIQPTNPDPQRRPQTGSQQTPSGEQSPSEDAPRRQPDVYIPSVSWHDAIRRNTLGLSSDAHQDANRFLGLVYKTARDPFSNANALRALHGVLERNGVDPNHPHMKEIMNMHLDTMDILQHETNKRMMSQFEG